MPDSKIAELLRGLGSREALPAWVSFLEVYSALISQVVRWSERDADESADCFLYVCEQLSRNQFRRLRRFHIDGRASFSTWLRAVVRNLCLDWHRQRVGRYRIFQSVARLPEFDQQVFHFVCQQGLSIEDCVAAMQQKFAGVSAEKIGTSLQRLRRVLSPHQLWLLNTRRQRTLPLNSDDPSGLPLEAREVADTAPDPETMMALKEGADGLHRALARLPNPDQLLLQLRFEQEMTLAEVAKTLSLKDAQTADRRIRDVLSKVRELLDVEIKVSGKTQGKSV